MAGTFASATVLMVDGRDPLEWRRAILGRERTVIMDNSPGGMGGRRAGDGVSGIKVHTGNARVPSIESEEFAVPLRALRWARIPDTAGPGRARGGCGVAREWEVLEDGVNFTLMAERAAIPAFGLFGGRAGATARYAVNSGRTGERVLPSKTPPVTLNRGDRFLLQSAGGGGYGAARQRPASQVLDDVLDGYVTRAGAERDYGVVIDAAGAVDTAATELLRADPGATSAPAGQIDPGTWDYGALSSSAS
jgi:N-methylhydantoinase B